MNSAKHFFAKILIFFCSEDRISDIVPCRFECGVPLCEQFCILFPELRSRNTVWFYCTHGAIKKGDDRLCIQSPPHEVYPRILIITDPTEAFKDINDFLGSIDQEKKDFIQKYVDFDKSLLETKENILSVSSTVVDERISEPIIGLFFSSNPEHKFGYFTSQQVWFISGTGEKTNTVFLKDIATRDEEVADMEIRGIDVINEYLLVETKGKLIKTFRKSKDSPATYKDTGNRVYLTTTLVTLPFNLRQVNKIRLKDLDQKINILKILCKRLSKPVVDVCVKGSTIYILACDNQNKSMEIHKYENENLERIVGAVGGTGFTQPCCFTYLYSIRAFVVAVENRVYVVNPEDPSPVDITSHLSQETLQDFMTGGDIVDLLNLGKDGAYDMLAIAQERRITLLELIPYAPHTQNLQ